MGGRPSRLQVALLRMFLTALVSTQVCRWPRRSLRHYAADPSEATTPPANGRRPPEGAREERARRAKKELKNALVENIALRESNARA